MPPSSLATSRANSTQQTPPSRGIYPPIHSLLPNVPPPSCAPLSKTPTPTISPRPRGGTPPDAQPNRLLTPCLPEGSTPVTPQALLTNLSANHSRPPNTRKSTYPADLTPTTSPLRPACAARDCLKMWKPALHPNHSLHAFQTIIQESDLSWIKDVIAHAWAESTKESYGSGLLVFHVFCDANPFPTQIVPLPAPS
ncbi:hypothetical protein PAXRUDRAFT_18525 [Paxillus rubicundulus Ve08.2h10]|uniref:Uncharacterized protein n=1 Tax=Paxillus rubicundulus Ve08.2h10 TaxID=930991 RepID=A0A0D0BXW2_9AGAM|nr:hypothetical protein PAXRUDRAFT_18525 [Paxillus rubicundulus Ve08.2h10]